MSAVLRDRLAGLAAADPTITDMLVQPDRPIRIAAPGGLQAASGTREPGPSAAAIGELAAQLLGSPAPLEHLQRAGGACTVAWQLGERRWRVDLALAHHAGDAAPAMELCIRVLPAAPPAWRDVSLPPTVKRSLTELSTGLVLVNGPSGSGKTTVLSALLQHSCDQADARIITLEDPIEYLLRPRADSGGTVSQRERGRHFRSFAAAARAAGRQHPGMVLVSDLHDAATAEAAVDLAQSALVLATTRTTFTIPALQRLCELLPDRRAALAGTLKGVLSLALVPSRNRSSWLQVCEWAGPDSDHLRAALVEQDFEQLRVALRGGKAARPRTEPFGLRSMNEDLAEALFRGDITPADARPASPDQVHLSEVLRATSRRPDGPVI